MNDIAVRYLEMGDPIRGVLSLQNPKTEIMLIPIEGRGHMLRIVMISGEIKRSLDLVMDDEALGILAGMFEEAVRRERRKDEDPPWRQQEEAFPCCGHCGCGDDYGYGHPENCPEQGCGDLSN